MRTQFQGVANIVRFNWHFYVLSGVILIGLLTVAAFAEGLLATLLITIAIVVFVAATISLAVSHYIYDRSDLYGLNFLNKLVVGAQGVVINIHAGFDETSAIIHKKYSLATLAVFDFYDPEKHTEVSIKRARKAYPPYPGTLRINTTSIPLPDASAELILLLFAAHEIRNDDERILFFREVKRVLKAKGKCVVTEHLRDLPNFLAYNIGCLHFLPATLWQKTFSEAGFTIAAETKTTSFVTSYTLTKYGDTT